ncbi:hypothetical protein [Galactobacter valiniphilus]|uniref:hypothetical protein n=1 Tax=Galactobacter valiniphilus TaxID=2676122 RepID=UPI003735D942
MPIAGVTELRVPAELHVFRVPRDDLDVVFSIDMTDAGVRPVAVTLRSAAKSEVTTSDWRLVNVQQIWRDAITRIARRVERDGTVVTEKDFLLPDDGMELLRAKGPVDETLRMVGELYSFADALGLAPVKQVQLAFEVNGLEPLPRTTATAWVKRARELGYIRGSE